MGRHKWYQTILLFVVNEQILEHFKMHPIWFILTVFTRLSSCYNIYTLPWVQKPNGLPHIHLCSSKHLLRAVSWRCKQLVLYNADNKKRCNACWRGGGGCSVVQTDFLAPFPIMVYILGSPRVNHDRKSVTYYLSWAVHGRYLLLFPRSVPPPYIHASEKTSWMLRFITERLLLLLYPHPLLVSSRSG